jgi:predicted DNA repair protein MutK
MVRVGLPEPRLLWLGYLVPELVLPFVVAGAHYLGHQ